MSRYVVDVTFPDSRTSYTSNKRYSYRTDENAEPGDLAVVVVSGEYKLTKVREVRKADFGDGWLKKAFRIVSLADERKVQQAEATRKQIVKRLEELAKEQDKMFIYERLAMANPEAAELLKQLKQL